MNLTFALSQSFVNNDAVRDVCLDCDVLIINNYLFDGELNAQVGRLLYGLRPGTKVISLRNFISPRYKASFDTVFDYFLVEKHEMSDIMSVSWTANKVPYYISTVQESILPDYLGRDDLAALGGGGSGSGGEGTPVSKAPSPDMLHNTSGDESSLLNGNMTPPTDVSELESATKN